MNKRFGKQVLSSLLLVTMLFSVVACSATSKTTAESQQTSTVGSQTSSLATTKDAKDIVVAGIVFQEDQYMKLLRLGYEDAAKKYGVKCLIGNTGNDQAKETELVNTYVAQKVDGIAIAPLSQTASVTALKNADDNGVKVAVINLELKDAPFIVGGYTSDHTNLGATTGAAAAKYIKEELGGKAVIGVLEFKSLFADISKQRVDGFFNEVKKLNPDATIVVSQDAWLQDKAVAVGGDILTAHPEINVLYAANDGGTIGAVMAVKNAGLAGKVVVFGVDTGDQQLAMLRDNDNILQAVTGQDPYMMGFTSMEKLILAIMGEDYSSTKGKTVIVPGVLVSRDDPDGITKFENDLKDKISKFTD